MTLPTNIRLDWKGLPRTNKLAYLANVLSYKEKVESNRPQAFYWFAMTHSMVNPIVYYNMNPT